MPFAAHSEHRVEVRVPQTTQVPSVGSEVLFDMLMLGRRFGREPSDLWRGSKTTEAKKRFRKIRTISSISTSKRSLLLARFRHSDSRAGAVARQSLPLYWTLLRFCFILILRKSQRDGRADIQYRFDQFSEHDTA